MIRLKYVHYYVYAYFFSDVLVSSKNRKRPSVEVQQITLKVILNSSQLSLPTSETSGHSRRIASLLPLRSLRHTRRCSLVVFVWSSTGREDQVSFVICVHRISIRMYPPDGTRRNIGAVRASGTGASVPLFTDFHSTIIRANLLEYSVRSFGQEKSHSGI